MRDIGEIIKELRESAGLNYAQVAARMPAYAKCTRQAIMKWESGGGDIMAFKYVRGIAHAFNRKPEELVAAIKSDEPLQTQETVAQYITESKPEALTLFEQLTPKQQTIILAQMHEMAADNAAAVEVHKRLTEPHYALASAGIIPGGAPKARTPKTHKRSA